MMLIAHDSPEHAQQSAMELAALGRHALKLMAECVEFTGVKRKQLSTAALALESSGFLFVRDMGDVWESRFELRPSLAGEEALEMLEKLSENT